MHTSVVKTTTKPVNTTGYCEWLRNGDMAPYRPARGSSETYNTAIRGEGLLRVAELGSCKEGVARSLVSLQERKEPTGVMLTQRTAGRVLSTWSQSIRH